MDNTGVAYSRSKAARFRIAELQGEKPGDALHKGGKNGEKAYACAGWVRG